MNDQVVSMLVGAGIVVALRLLDWAFPKGYVWRRVQSWSVRSDDEDQTDRKR